MGEACSIRGRDAEMRVWNLFFSARLLKFLRCQPASYERMSE